MAQYTLRLSFDLRQVTQSLAYKFFLDDKFDYPMESGGPLAGTFNFQKGDDIFVEVSAISAANVEGKGVSAKDVLNDFVVTNCTFVSVPARMTEPLSLFNLSNACAAISAPADWGDISRQVDEQKNVQRLSRRSVKALAVVSENGQWQISGYLSAELTSADDKTHPQLYFFDPESSTGTGGGYGP
jgi:hypothetical protein